MACGSNKYIWSKCHGIIELIIDDDRLAHQCDCRDKARNNWRNVSAIRLSGIDVLSSRRSIKTCVSVFHSIIERARLERHFYARRDDRRRCARVLLKSDERDDIACSLSHCLRNRHLRRFLYTCRLKYHFSCCEISRLFFSGTTYLICGIYIPCDAHEASYWRLRLLPPTSPLESRRGIHAELAFNASRKRRQRRLARNAI